MYLLFSNPYCDDCEYDFCSASQIKKGKKKNLKKHKVYGCPHLDTRTNSCQREPKYQNRTNEEITLHRGPIRSEATECHIWKPKKKKDLVEKTSQQHDVFKPCPSKWSLFKSKVHSLSTIFQQKKYSRDFKENSKRCPFDQNAQCYCLGCEQSYFQKNDHKPVPVCLLNTNTIREKLSPESRKNKKRQYEISNTQPTVESYVSSRIREKPIKAKKVIAHPLKNNSLKCELNTTKKKQFYSKYDRNNEEKMLRYCVNPIMSNDFLMDYLTNVSKKDNFQGSAPTYDSNFQHTHSTKGKTKKYQAAKLAPIINKAIVEAVSLQEEPSLWQPHQYNRKTEVRTVYGANMGLSSGTGQPIFIPKPSEGGAPPCQHPHDMVKRAVQKKYNTEIICVDDPTCVILNGCLNMPRAQPRNVSPPGYPPVGLCYATERAECGFLKKIFKSVSTTKSCPKILSVNKSCQHHKTCLVAKECQVRLLEQKDKINANQRNLGRCEDASTEQNIVLQEDERKSYKNANLNDIFNQSDLETVLKATQYVQASYNTDDLVGNLCVHVPICPKCSVPMCCLQDENTDPGNLTGIKTILFTSDNTYAEKYDPQKSKFHKKFCRQKVQNKTQNKHMIPSDEPDREWTHANVDTENQPMCLCKFSNIHLKNPLNLNIRGQDKKKCFCTPETCSHLNKDTHVSQPACSCRENATVMVDGLQTDDDSYCSHVPICSRIPKCVAKKYQKKKMAKTKHLFNYKNYQNVQDHYVALISPDNFCVQAQSNKTTKYSRSLPCKQVPSKHLTACKHKPCCGTIPACCLRLPKEVKTTGSQYPASCRIT